MIYRSLSPSLHSIAGYLVIWSVAELALKHVPKIESCCREMAQVSLDFQREQTQLFFHSSNEFGNNFVITLVVFCAMYVRTYATYSVLWCRCICVYGFVKKTQAKFDLIPHFRHTWQAHAYAHSMQRTSSSMVFKLCFQCFLPFELWVLRPEKREENHHTLEYSFGNIFFWKDFV